MPQLNDTLHDPCLAHLTGTFNDEWLPELGTLPGKQLLIDVSLHNHIISTYNVQIYTK